MRAADLMTRNVLTVLPRTTVREAAKALASNGFTALPVVDDDGRLLGVITEADVIRNGIPAPRDRRVAQPTAPTTVGEIMTVPAMALPPSTEAAELASFMLRTGIRSVPIVDGLSLVGIVTRRDLVRSLVRDDADLATDVRRRLELYGGPGRWRVEVRRGRVTIHDERDDPVDAHVAKIIALAVPGVEFAKVVG
jgi:CBS domain-containing protein